MNSWAVPFDQSPRLTRSSSASSGTRRMRLLIILQGNDDTAPFPFHCRLLAYAAEV